MKVDSDKIFNFDKTQLKNELKNILEGKSQIGQGNIIQAVSRFYRENEGASKTTEKTASTKEEETKILTAFIEKEELGIILEDLHDENVLTNNGIPFFIDSAIYLSKISEESK